MFKNHFGNLYPDADVEWNIGLDYESENENDEDNEDDFDEEDEENDYDLSEAYYNHSEMNESEKEEIVFKEKADPAEPLFDDSINDM